MLRINLIYLQTLKVLQKNWDKRFRLKHSDFNTIKETKSIPSALQNILNKKNLTNANKQ